MTSFAVASIVLCGTFGAALLGMMLNTKLPVHQLNPDSREVVKLVMGLIATISALVLSLLIASASTSYARQSSKLTEISANIIQLDQTLEAYGPSAKLARDQLREAARRAHDRIWSQQGVRPEHLNSLEMRNVSKDDVEQLYQLSPTNDTERMIQNRAIMLAENTTQARLLMFEQLDTPISWPFLTVVIFWVCTLFIGFGLFSSPNATVTVALFLGAVSVACAIFLIMEMNAPFTGIMRISDVPLRRALAQIDR